MAPRRGGAAGDLECDLQEDAFAGRARRGGTGVAARGSAAAAGQVHASVGGGPGGVE